MGSHSSAEYGIVIYSDLKDEYTGKGINVFWGSSCYGKYTFFQRRESLFAHVRHSITNTIAEKLLNGW
jgi:hypothetical protein